MSMRFGYINCSQLIRMPTGREAGKRFIIYVKCLTPRYHKSNGFSNEANNSLRFILDAFRFHLKRYQRKKTKKLLQ